MITYQPVETYNNGCELDLKKNVPQLQPQKIIQIFHYLNILQIYVFFSS